MSRGMGKIQRECMVELHRRNHASAGELARTIYGGEPTIAQLVSVRRALRKLAQAGTLTDMGNQWRYGTKHYGTPDNATAHRMREEQIFGRRVPRIAPSAPQIAPPAEEKPAFPTETRKGSVLERTIEATNHE
jgi:hypothetical protein